LPFDFFVTLDALGKNVYRNAPILKGEEMRTIDYLNAVQSRYALTSDYQLAHKLGLTRSNISVLRNCKGFQGEETATFIAKLLDLPPARVVAHANAERWTRANKPELAQMWLDVAAKFGAETAPIPA
jgi:hypothetical protein